MARRGYSTTAIRTGNRVRITAALVTTLSTLTLALYASHAPAQELRFGYNRPSNEMDFNLPPLPSLEESVPSAAPEDIAAERERFFSDQAILDEFDEQMEQAPPPPPATPQQKKPAPQAEKPAAQKRSRRPYPVDNVRFRRTSNQPFRFKSVRLPGSIYKKNYRRENAHLPVAEYGKDRHIAMVRSAKQGEVSHMRALKIAGTPVDAHDNNGTPPLIAAAQHNQLASVHWLATQNTALNQMDAQGLTALHYAALQGNALVTETLLAYGANANLADIRGYTPLHYAARSGSAETVKTLIELGAYVQARTPNGETALHMAASSGNYPSEQLLRQHGISAHQTNKQGITPDMYRF